MPFRTASNGYKVLPLYELFGPIQISKRMHGWGLTLGILGHYFRGPADQSRCAE